MAIKAVIFDLGKVLIDFDWQLAVERIAPFTELAKKHIFTTAIDSGLIRKYETGLLNDSEFCQQMVNLLQADIEPAKFSSIWCEIFQRRPEMEDLFLLVKTKVPVAILSDTSRLHWNYISKFAPRIACPNALILSYETGSCKPEPFNYRKALATLGKEPTECVFIDDREKNVEGAKSLGIKAFQYQNPEQVKTRLRELGVLEY